MPKLSLPSPGQMSKIELFSPRSHGVARVDDHRVISGVVYVLTHGLQWNGAPCDYGPYKTLYNRSRRWKEMGVFDIIFSNLVALEGATDTPMRDAYQGASNGVQPSKRGLLPHHVGRAKGGPNTRVF